MDFPKPFCVLQIGQITLIFFINEVLITKIIERDVSGEIFSSFKDLENENFPSSSSMDMSPGGLSAAPRNHSLYSPLLPSPFGLSHPRPAQQQTLFRINSRFGAGSLGNNSFTPSSGEEVADDADGSSVPIVQPPASYVTIA